MAKLKMELPPLLANVEFISHLAALDKGFQLNHEDSWHGTVCHLMKKCLMGAFKADENTDNY